MNKELALLIKEKLVKFLPKGEDKLSEAVLYATLSGGKRIRGSLLIYLADLFKVDREESLHFAAIIELLHEYTLVHDDIIDGDDERRGVESCYKKYGQSIAILAGNTILTYAFELIMRSNLEHRIKNDIVFIVCDSIGYNGLMKGQYLDIEGGSKSIDVALLKTSPLFIAIAKIVSVIANLDVSNERYLYRFARDLGVAYQIADDINDSKSESEKTNIVNELGSVGSFSLYNDFFNSAKKNLLYLGKDLKEILEFLNSLIVWKI
ncbi:Isoprenoid biosynthesis protein [Candidatus Cyrtobacter comes]|uniref:Isoprenoid biosynthesis protein n=1 Tax=Candidatus Cyrtobacter comes TaxID=675776 RepID=A0ABU5L6L6_9RICK|nr:polyprenyl synthetase family protein [Candidatus Cyrtobacter comes]MDZ5761692.1 Isoprenoid biosynthesis protein [Candidatus Cyrtobacter comes]